MYNNLIEIETLVSLLMVRSISLILGSIPIKWARPIIWSLRQGFYIWYHANLHISHKSELKWKFAWIWTNQVQDSQNCYLQKGKRRNYNLRFNWFLLKERTNVLDFFYIDKYHIISPENIEELAQLK